jgi:PEP-CTERM motif
MCMTWFRSVGVVTMVANAVFILMNTANAGVVFRNVNVTLDATQIESFDLDVDLNGSIDFRLTSAFVPDPAFPIGFNVIDFPLGTNNGVVIDGVVADGFPTVSRLQLGGIVSGASLFSFPSIDQGNLSFFTAFDPPSGNFEEKTGYIGLRFERPNGLSFGFAEITVNSSMASLNPLGLTIGQVGYEEVAGAGVTISAVPEPSSLSLMGLGMVGLIFSFRRKSGR